LWRNNGEKWRKKSGNGEKMAGTRVKMVKNKNKKKIDRTTKLLYNISSQRKNPF
jgi:hypothetical protein